MDKNKEIIMINGVDVSKCKHLYSRWSGSLPKDTMDDEQFEEFEKQAIKKRRVTNGDD